MEDVKEVVLEVGVPVEEVVKTKEEILMDDAIALIGSTKLRFDDKTLSHTLGDESTGEESKVEIDKDFADNYKRFTVLFDLMKESHDAFREHLTEYLEKHKLLDKYESNGIIFLYTKPHVRNTIDSALLKKQLPGVAAIYNKKSNVKASSRISLSKDV